MILTWGRLLSKWRANVCLIQITIIWQYHDAHFKSLSSLTRSWWSRQWMGSGQGGAAMSSWYLFSPSLTSPTPLSEHVLSKCPPNCLCIAQNSTVSTLNTIHWSPGPTPAECARTFIAILHQVCVTSILKCAFIAQFVLLALLKLKSSVAVNLKHLCFFR